MKKLALITLATLAIISCKKETGYHISGNLTGFKTNETVYINKISVSRATDKYVIVEALKHIDNHHIVMDQRAYHEGSTQIDYPVPLVINSGEVFTVEVQSVLGSSDETYIEVYAEER